MAKDNGHEAVAPVNVEQVDRDALAEHVRHKWGGESIYTAFARHRQASYNQALKDAAEVVESRAADLRVGAVDWRRTVKAILSLGDKGNG